MTKQYKSVKRVKTNAMERRLSMAKAGVFAGAKFATSSAFNLFNDKATRQEKQKENLATQSQYLVDELGKLKGSVVKLGQLLSLWGEGFLPKEVIEALHTMSDDTAIVEWTIMRSEIERYLSAQQLAELDINDKPIGAASLGQVYLATRRSDNEKICLKVQYPGVATAIDSDLKAFSTLLRVTRLVPITREFEEWLDEVKTMFKREVDYELELRTTARFHEALQNDPRYIVPNTYPEYSSLNIVATSYEPGYSLNDSIVLNLSQGRRNKIATACIELCWKEVFDWGEMQTDPNFGNYFVRLDKDGENDRLVSLDFGAVRKFSNHILEPGKRLIAGAFTRNPGTIKQALLDLGFIKPDFPASSLQEFTELFYLAMEPFADPTAHPPAEDCLTAEGEYQWAKSNLANRAIAQAGKSAASKHFAVPPKELMFLTRKLVGAFALMSILGAEIKGFDLLSKYMDA